MTQTELAGRLPGAERPIPVQSIVASSAVEVRLFIRFEGPREVHPSSEKYPAPGDRVGGFFWDLLGLQNNLDYVGLLLCSRAAKRQV